MSTDTPDVFNGLEFVSRGGQKLEKALTFFNISPQDKVCIDCGASTGGFTDCLLQKGARLVYAVDVGYGQLAWSLRNDKRVVVMERTNIRYVTADMIEEKPELAVVDLSFISLSLVLPVIHGLMKSTEDESDISKLEAICLIKPQFEAGKGKVGKKGVVREPEIHVEVLEKFKENAEAAGFIVKDITYSPVKGPKGNIEYLGWLRKHDSKHGGEAAVTIDAAVNIDTKRIVSESHKELSN